MTKEKPSYYSILTADVRYDRKLSANQKILFSEITCLTNKYGYCKASNSYFSKLYDVTPETVSRWISKLKKSGYIEVKIIYEKGTKQIAERRIYLLTKTSIPIDDNVNTPIDKIINTPIDKNVKDNNTSNNIKESKPKKKRFTKPTANQVREYLKESNNDNKIDADYFIDYYQAKDWMIGSNRMKDWKAAVRTWIRREDKGRNNEKSKSSVRDEIMSRVQKGQYVKHEWKTREAEQAWMRIMKTCNLWQASEYQINQILKEVTI